MAPCIRLSTAAGKSRIWPISRSGLEFGDRNVGIAEFDPDHGNAGAPGHADIGAGVADHDGRSQCAAGPRHRLLQDAGIGLGDAERVGAADRGKPRGSRPSWSSSSFDSHSSLLVQTAKR